MALIVNRSLHKGMPLHPFYVRVVAQIRKSRLPYSGAKNVEDWLEKQSSLAFERKIAEGLTEEDRLRRPSFDNENALQDAARVEADRVRRTLEAGARDWGAFEQRSIAMLEFYVDAETASDVQAQPIFQEYVSFDFDFSAQADSALIQAYRAVKIDIRYASVLDA